MNRYLKESLIVVVAFFGLSLSACGESGNSDAGLPREITVEQVNEFDNAQWVDVRTEREWQSGHLEAAYHLPVRAISAETAAELPKGQPLLVYCAVGGRASAAAEKLRELGFSAIAVRGGGYEQLKAQRF